MQPSWRGPPVLASRSCPAGGFRRSIAVISSIEEAIVIPSFPLPALPALAGVPVLGGFGLNRYFKRKAARERSLPVGATALAETPPVWPWHRQGRLSIIRVGTAGRHIGQRAIDNFQKGGCLGDIGVDTLFELDE